MNDFVTIEKITDWLTEQVQKKNPIGGDVWADAALKINVLLQGEQEKLFLLEQEVAKLKNIVIESGESVAKAQAKVETTPEYLAARKQKAKVIRSEELIRLSKVQSRLASDILRGN